MLRQDRTSPSTAISNWRGRRDTKKAWPSTGVSTWLNGGLFGAAPLTAFGGIITQYEDSGTTYRVHTFRGSGKFYVANGAANVDVLVCAGGGGGGGSGAYHVGGGGGGAGGLETDTGVAVSAGTYTITVGAGGAQGDSGDSGGSLGTRGSDGGAASALGVSTSGGGGGEPTVPLMVVMVVQVAVLATVRERAVLARQTRATTEATVVQVAGHRAVAAARVPLGQT